MPLNATDAAIGDLLILQRLLSLAQLDEATEIAASCKVRLADIILSQCWMKPSQLYRTLAQHFSLPFLDLAIDPPDGALFEEGLADDYLRHLVVPWRRAGGQLLIATAQPGPETILFARAQWGTAIDFVVASKLDIFRYVQDTLRDSQSERAIHELARADPDMSADHVLTCGQLAAFFALFTGLAAGIAFAPAVTLIALNGFLTLFFVGNFIFRGVLAWIGSREPRRSSLQLEIDARLLREDELPVYTVLVPLFQEPEVLPILAGALRDMDYPVAKLDIKLVVEENDGETIAAAQALGLEGAVELILVPACAPQTKSKACNYALRFALGELLVIYDAEDKPERDQLRKVVAAFRASPPGTACIQCQLNYYNIRENWLTRMFTLE
jgi:hypothetical protein